MKRKNTEQDKVCYLSSSGPPYMHTFHYKQNNDTFMGSLVRDDTLSLDKLSCLCMRVNSCFPNDMLLAIFD